MARAHCRPAGKPYARKLLSTPHQKPVELSTCSTRNVPSSAQLLLKSTRTLPGPRPIVHIHAHTESDNAMLILHTNQDRGNLVLWGEDSEPRLTQSEWQADGKHHYCAEAQRVA